MEAAELARLAARLEEFIEEMFSSLGRSDQRAIATKYVQGLLLDGPRKTMRLMAQQLNVDHQRLQQFVTSSPWESAPVAARLAARSSALLAPSAWVVRDWSHRKTGCASVGVARQRAEGDQKRTNCQLAVAVHAVGRGGSVPLNWRLFIPVEWDDRCVRSPEQSAIQQRRTSCGIPDHERHRSRSSMALEMLDELIAGGNASPLVVADCWDGLSADFIVGLRERGLRFLAVGPPTMARAEVAETVSGRRAYPRLVTSIVESGFVAERYVVGVARDNVPPLSQVWAVRRSAPEGTGPSTRWVTNLLPEVALGNLAELAELTVEAGRGIAALRAVGLNDFEGRSWRGWHHHVTLTLAARLFQFSTTAEVTGRAEQSASDLPVRAPSRLQNFLPRLAPAVTKSFPGDRSFDEPRDAGPRRVAAR